MAGQKEYQVPELARYTILELRARTVHLLERAEHHIEAEDQEFARVLIELATRTPSEIHAILAYTIKKWAGPCDLSVIHSEMFTEDTTLDQSISVWSMLFSRGSDDPFEMIEDLENEINICFEIEVEGENE